MMSEMEALFQAVRVCSPEFSWGGVDMITDSNVLHELLCFCGSPGNRRDTTRTIFSSEQVPQILT